MKTIVLAAVLMLAACAADRTPPQPSNVPSAVDEGRCPTCQIP